MFFRRKHFIEFGYKVMGLDFGNNDTYNNYVKYFDEHNSMVVCSTIYDNKVMVYRLTPEQYKDFHAGKYALSHDGKGYGKTPTGHDVMNYGHTNVFKGGELSNRKSLKEFLDLAEEIAKGGNPKYEIVTKIKRKKI